MASARSRYLGAAALSASLSQRIADAARRVLPPAERKSLARWRGFEEHDHLALRLMHRRVLALRRAAGA